MLKRILLSGVILAAFMLLLRYLQLHYVMLTLPGEIYAGIIALLFTLVGIWLGNIILTKSSVIETAAVPSLPTHPQIKINSHSAAETGLSKRELEVLTLMAEGYSNQQIADKIFISLSTVKTHSTGIFVKLDAKRRTEAVKKARELQIIN